MLIQADAFNLPYPDKYFHSCVTSPPYWGLRKYSGNQGDEPLGLEATPERHIERMVEVFREVWRVLRDDGVLWLNYGDCFAGGGRGKSDTPKQASNAGHGETGPGYRGIYGGNLMLMPHRLAIALQADGWIVRNDLVWFKRNPMPESVAGWRWERSKTRLGDDPRRDYSPTYNNHAQRQHDGPDKFAQPEYEYGDDYVLRKSSWRHTRAHEYVFQLVKGMGYYANQEAVREANAPATGWTNWEPKFHNPDRNDGGKPEGKRFGYGRNPRSVLDVPTAPYKGSHYATFPPKLIAPLIRASVPRRCCPVCGAAYAPVVERHGDSADKTRGSYAKEMERIGANNKARASGFHGDVDATVTDYRPTCDHEGEPIPGIVLDIFGGSGTTGMVAKQLLRRWVVMDISRPYLDEQAKIRTGSGTPANALDGLPMFE